jgi:hypothetical protein
MEKQFTWYLNGRSYKLSGNRYEETVLYHDMINIPDLVGAEDMMLLKLSGDTLTQIHPVEDNGNLMKEGTTIEKYVRLKGEMSN